MVGWLFVLTYVTSIAAKFAFYPPLFEDGYITGPGEDTRVLWGAFCEAVLIVANIGTAVALYSVLKRYHESLALGFVAARIMESVFIGVGILAVLTVVTLRQDLRGRRRQSAAADHRRQRALTLQEWTFNLGPAFVVGVGNGCILGYMMYRSGLVPRRHGHLRPGRGAVPLPLRLGGDARPHRARLPVAERRRDPGVLLGARPRHLPHRAGVPARRDVTRQDQPAMTSAADARPPGRGRRASAAGGGKGRRTTESGRWPPGPAASPPADWDRQDRRVTPRRKAMHALVYHGPGQKSWEQVPDRSCSRTRT